MLPQIIYLALAIFGLGFVLAQHGKPQGKFNFWASLLSTLIGLGLLWWGGFFDVFIGG